MAGTGEDEAEGAELGDDVEGCEEVSPRRVVADSELVAGVGVMLPGG